MSHYKSYPKYKESIIYWVKKVPENWEIAATGRALEPKNHNVGSLWRSTPLLSLTQKGVVNRDINNLTGKTHSDYSTYQIVEKHDLIFCLFDIDETPRTVGLANSSGMITSAYNVFRARESANRVFLYFFFEFIDNCKGLKPFYTGMRKTVRPPEFLKIKIPLPPRVEQNLIAEHLATETTRIDALIEKKTRFIELLKEKRQALITQAVTKGLDLNVKMKDSGVEWLGEVPEHWVVSKLKRMGRLKGGAGFPPDMQGQTGMPVSFYKVGDLGRSKDGIHLRDAQHTISCEDVMKLGAHVFAPDSLCWAKIGAALSLNRRRLIGTNACLDNNMTGFICDEHVALPRYMLHLMSVVDFSVHAKPGAVPSFSEGDQGELAIPAPSFQEQVVIAEHIDHAISKVDTLVLSVEKSVQLLKERRSALITAAVTGQIDLRDAA